MTTAEPTRGERRARLHVSQLVLLRVILAFRLLFLILMPVQEGIGRGLAEHAVLLKGLAAAVLYTLILVVLSKSVIAFHLRGWAFTAIDIGVVFLIYFATGSGSSWPFFLFGSTTILVAGLRGKVGGALVATIAWNLLSSAAWVAKGMPFGRAFGISSFDDLFNLSLVAAIWAYTIGLIARLHSTEGEVNRSRETLAAMNRALDGQETEIIGLLEIGNAIARHVDLPSILTIATEALGAMGFGRNRLWLLREGWLTTDAEDADPRAIPADDPGPLALAVRDRVTVTVRQGDAGTDPKSLPGVRAGTLATVVPVVAGSEAFGAVVVESRSGAANTPEDDQLITMFAEVIALALRHAHFYERAQDQAVAEERHRLSVEMRETVVGEVGAAVAAAERLVAQAKTAEAVRKTEALAESLRAGMKDLRVAVLNWDSLDWTGSAADTARRYVEQWSELSDIAVDWASGGRECGVDTRMAQDLLRILQEALSNAWRHGQAGIARVTLRFGTDGIDLSVRDDGSGFDLEAVEKGTGVGLRSIRSRAERNGGRADIESTPGGGTTVSVWMPCVEEGS